MDDKDWMLLQALKRYGSITQAASAMFVSQPAISKRLRLLEEELHTNLVLRTSGGIQLTPAGEYLARYADEMLLRLQQVRDDISQLSSGQETLHIGIPSMFSQLVMPDILQAFAKEYPAISPSTRSGFSTDIAQWLKNRQVQVAFIRGAFSDANYDSYPISVDPICLISDQKILMEQLPTLPRIVYKTDPQLQEKLTLWWHSRFPGKKMVTGMEVGDSQTCIHLVEQGGGYALIPFYVLSEQARQKLWIVPLADGSGAPVLRQTCLVYPKGAMAASVRLFVEFIKEYFAPAEPPPDAVLI